MKRRWILLVLLAAVLQLWAQSDTTQVSEQWSYGTTIGQEDMNNRDQSSNAIDAIRGRVAGMTVDQSGENAMSADAYRAFCGSHGLSYMDKGANTNWQKEITRTSFSHHHHLAFTGGTKLTTYRASVGY